MYYNTETREFGLSEGEVKSHFVQEDVAVIWGDPFSPMAPFVEVLKTEKPEHDPASHKVQEVAPEETEAGWLQKWELVALTPQEISTALQVRIAQLEASAAARRWEVETGGIVINGMRLLTKVEDQNRITSAVVNAERANIEEVSFIAVDGPVRLSLDELRGIAIAITQHVQACFNAQGNHILAIRALESLADANAYNVNTGWPDPVIAA